MNTANSKPSTSAVFPAGVTEPEGLAGLGSGAWPLARLAASGGCGLKNMRLVRWRELRAFLGKRWADKGRDIAATLRQEIETRLAPGSSCVRYDDFSFLVVCPDPSDPLLRSLDIDFVDTVGTKLVGVLGTADLIEVWKPVAIEDEGFSFERQGAKAGAGTDREAATGAAGEISEEPSPAPEPGTPSQTVILGDAGFRRFPLWDVRGNEVFCYLFEAFWDLGTGDALSEEALEEQFRDPKRTLALDLEILAKATEELDRGLDQYLLVKFLIPVHYETLADPAAADTYFRFCNRKIWSVREFAYFEIIKPPATVSADDLAQAAQRVKPFGAGVMLRVDRGFESFDRVPADDVLSVGMDLRLDGRPENEIIAELETLASEAGARGLHSHVHGLTARNLSAAAACAGIDFIGSNAIAESLDEWVPDETMAKPIDMFKSLLAAAKAAKGDG
ncbi:MAG: hypothetical protein ACE5GT_03275 [Rhodospirillales bacterium]